MVSAVLRRPALAAFFSAISRRAFLSMSLRAAAGSVLASILAPLRSAFAGTPAIPRLFRRIVTRDNKSSAMIEWQTDAELSKPRFFWREAGNKSEKIADVDVKYFALTAIPYSSIGPRFRDFPRESGSSAAWKRRERRLAHSRFRRTTAARSRR